MPRTELERRQRIKALNDDYNQLYIRNPGYGNESISWSPAGKEIYTTNKNNGINSRQAIKLYSHHNKKRRSVYH